MARELRIGDRVINDESDCFVIAEIGHNHQGSVAKAKELFKAAKECGVDAVKLQKRDNKTLFTKEAYDKPYDNENSFGDTYGAHREALEFGWDQYVELKAYAEELGVIMFATAFDMPSVDFLAKLDLPLFKVASADLTNIPLLRYVAQVGKPMLVSTGGATLDDVKRAYDTIMPINSQLSMLQCTAAYPVSHEELNLRVISAYREMFPTSVIGLSDHDNGIAMATAAYVLGCRVVEKHFTLNHTWKGTDHAFSLEPIGMRKLVRDMKRVRIALGDGQKCVFEDEKKPIMKMSKKLVAAREIPAGHVLTPADVAVKSPGDGLSAAEYDNVLGRVTAVSLKPEQNLSWEVLAGLGKIVEAVDAVSEKTSALVSASHPEAKNQEQEQPRPAMPVQTPVQQMGK